MSPTPDGPAADTNCAPDCCSHWSRGSWPTPPNSITDADGWTLRSATGCRTAHSEHTIAITSDGAEILTLPKHPQT